ncbi:hypothetical protein [Streptomyces sp. NPDC046261]|uniref:hypothetical protein n=1 Tax=Streptomyces sp. NPDC046261 TaxID=3157200 RepID=UPI0033EDF9AA
MSVMAAYCNSRNHTPPVTLRHVTRTGARHRRHFTAATTATTTSMTTSAPDMIRFLVFGSTP